MLTLAPSTAPDSVFLPWQKSSLLLPSSPSLYPRCGNSSLYTRSALSRPLACFYFCFCFVFFLFLSFLFLFSFFFCRYSSLVASNKRGVTEKSPTEGEASDDDGLDSEAKRRIDYRRSFEESSAAEMTFLPGALSLLEWHVRTRLACKLPRQANVFRFEFSWRIRFVRGSTSRRRLIYKEIQRSRIKRLVLRDRRS